LEEDRYEEQMDLAREKIGEMKEAMDKIAEVVISDKKQFEYKFLGIYELRFSKAVKIVLLVLFSFVPSLFDKYTIQCNRVGCRNMLTR
jgi:hypothetical protein